MKIVKLKAENIKRLSAVEITPEGNVITIGGKNGAGKSSVLDSISYALGGTRLVPTEPIRKGKLKGEITVNLGDYIVTRRFTRAKPEHQATSTLTIKTAEGGPVQSPQTMLDSLLGELSFDPLAFANHAPSQQRGLLQELVGLDTTKVDTEITEVYSARRDYKKRHQVASAKLEGMPRHAITPDNTLSIDDIAQEMLEAERISHQKGDKRRLIEDLEHRAESNKHRADHHEKKIKDLEAQLQDQRDELKTAWSQYEQDHVEIDEAKTAYAEIEVPDVDALKEKVSKIEEHNKKAADNAKRKEQERQSLEWQSDMDKADLKLIELKERKDIMIESANYPIDGLKVEEDGVYFNNIPFEQLSTAEKLRISVAIGVAYNPTLKILLIRDGSALDSESLALVAKLAEDADAQVWLERVSENKSDDIQVMIEDGAQQS